VNFIIIVIVLRITHFCSRSRIVESWIAIRYLGRILECPTFWTQPSHENHQGVIKKLVRRVTQLVEDVDLEYPTITIGYDLPMAPRADMQGIDTISCALLVGAKICDWEAIFLSGPLLDDFKQLVGIFRL
jgi:hypothetical protein